MQPLDGHPPTTYPPTTYLLSCVNAWEHGCESAHRTVHYIPPHTLAHSESRFELQFCAAAAEARLRVRDLRVHRRAHRWVARQEPRLPHAEVSMSV
jgi:hypothetical protein